MRITHVALAIALAGVTACQGWKQVARPTPSGSLEGNPEVVRVTRTMGCGPTPSRACMESRGTITLYNPRIQGDSLIGYYDRDNREACPRRTSCPDPGQGRHVAVALSDITNVESKKVDKLRTTGAVLGGAVVAYAVVGVLAVIALLAALN